MHRSIGVGLGLFIAALVGCAVGTTDDTSTGVLGNAPEPNADQPPSMTIPQPSQHAHDDDAGRPDSGGTQEGGAGSCAETNACASATDLGPISGDSGGDTKHATGSTSQWLTVNVSEDDHSVDGNSLEVKAALVSPAGANFDLFVYVPGDTGGRECSAVTQKSESTTDRDEAGVEFGEDGGDWSNGGGDGRTVTLEVRWVSGPCSPGSTWTLDVTGNQH